MNTYEIAYGNLTSSNIQAFSQLEGWNAIVEKCTRLPEIDIRLQSIVNRLLQDEEFKTSWDKLRKMYGNTPSVKLDENVLTCVNAPYCAFPAKSSTGPVMVKILQPPLITCSAQHFPAVAVLNLVQHVFSLDINSLDNQENEEKKSLMAAIKVIRWVYKNNNPEGFFDLAEIPTTDSKIKQDVHETAKIVLSYSKGKRSVNSVEGEMEPWAPNLAGLTLP